MTAFIDTSTLFKKYLDEEGSQEFGVLLDSIFEIVVSPVTCIEFHSIIERRLRERTVSSKDAEWIRKEFLTDYQYFGIVTWTDDILTESLRIVRKYQLRTLDSIQLSCALAAQPSVFITSDKQLYLAAKKELPQVKYM